MGDISEKLEFVNMIAGESEMAWRSARKENPKEVRDYIVHVGQVNWYGEKRGFITFAHWTGNAWDRFALISEERIPHITHWIEWFPKAPDGYIQED